MLDAGPTGIAIRDRNPSDGIGAYTRAAHAVARRIATFGEFGRCRME